MSFSGVMPGTPLIARLEAHGGLGHLERRRGQWLSPRVPSCRTPWATSGTGLHHAIHLLQQLRCLASRQARLGRRHEENIALIERRHELAAESQRRDRRERQKHERDPDRRTRPREHALEAPAGTLSQPAIQRVAVSFGMRPRIR
jgi:hypothetical protein